MERDTTWMFRFGNSSKKTVLEGDLSDGFKKMEKFKTIKGDVLDGFIHVEELVIRVTLIKIFGNLLVKDAEIQREKQRKWDALKSINFLKKELEGCGIKDDSLFMNLHRLRKIRNLFAHFESVIEDGKLRFKKDEFTSFDDVEERYNEFSELQEKSCAQLEQIAEKLTRRQYQKKENHGP